METTYNEVQLNIFRDRYAHEGEQFPHEAWRRVSAAVAEHEKTVALREEWSGRFMDLLNGFRYLPGGR
ncbi:MAG: hypothetical protein KC482_04110, partial [Dehalococcoidia bacterium]|nr:hypothetical protein [Dehalococcoidia bacterium]